MAQPDKTKQTNPSGHSFKRSQRLVEAAQFRRVFESNDKLVDRYWTILYRENGGEYARLGMAVSKKRARRSVDRSRLKRLVRESFRLRELPGVDIVVMPRDITVKTSSQDLLSSLNRQWSRIAERCTR